MLFVLQFHLHSIMVRLYTFTKDLKAIDETEFTFHYG